MDFIVDMIESAQPKLLYFKDESDLTIPSGIVLFLLSLIFFSVQFWDFSAWYWKTRVLSWKD